MKRNKKTFFLILSACAVLAAVFVWHYLEKSTAVTVVRAERGTAVLAVYATGTVESNVTVPLAPRHTARLVEILADEGDAVKAGDVLARLDDAEIQKTLDELEARVGLAESDYARKSRLAAQNVVSVEDMERARAERNAARAARDRTRVQMEEMRLKAPADGRVIRRDGEPGAIIQAGQPVFFLACCTGIRVTAEIDEEDIALVKPGQDVILRADAFPDQVFEGQVDSITPQGDPVARSYRVRIGLPPNTLLMIGMTAEANIVIRETPDALLLPLQTVQHGKIWLADNGILRQRSVKTGAQTQNGIEIIDGLTEDDLVVLNPSPDFKEGQTVKTVLKTQVR
ncbi:MAG: efflux RND transporter periplasmic adaptor subunit [Micavibrio sp.]|nr:MAG: efflux RND transporter periplasmic adaptor subunit [Micavibrio sp.]